MKNFVESLGAFYPCRHCAAALRDFISKNPPRSGCKWVIYPLLNLHVINRTASREEFACWMCEMHNDVNSKLGKPTVSCSISDLDLRWRTGNPSCWEETTEAAETLGQE